MFDVNSIIIFDNGYFQSIVVGCGILIIDNVFFIDNCIKFLVIIFVQDQIVFFDVFKELMVKMGCIGVLIGIQGQICKQCWVCNFIDFVIMFDVNMEFVFVSLEFCMFNFCFVICFSNIVQI